MKHLLLVIFIAAGSAGSPAGWSYDARMAAHFAGLFSQVKEADAGKALHFISAEALVKDLKAKKDMVTIDVRTPAETAMLSLNLPGNLNIPVDRIFEPANLDRIPTDRPVIIVCKSGARASRRSRP